MGIGPVEAVRLRRDFENHLHSRSFGDAWLSMARTVGLSGQDHARVLGLDARARAWCDSAGVRHEPLAERLLRAQRGAVRNGSLYWASPDMTRLAASAALTLSDFGPRATDFPSRRGVLLCAEPFRYSSPQVDPFETAFVGLAWSIEVAREADSMARFAGALAGVAKRGGAGVQRPGEVAEVLYLGVITDPEQSLSAAAHEASPQARRLTGSRLAHEDETVVPLGITFSSSGTYEDGTIRPTAFLRSMLALIASPGVAAVSDWKPSRAERARAKRRRLGELGAVRVIDVRRRPPRQAQSMSSRERHHRWVVDGHWRNQWYPSEGRHRPIWINAYVKGPDGAPMLTGEKVKAIR